MGICNLSSILLLIILISTTPFHPFTLASSETNLNKNPNLKTISKANDDGESSGIEHVWCVAKNNAEDVNLQAAIDWACSNGGVDCGPIQENKACYDPTNIQSTASYVFNDYYRKNGQTDESCNFSGVATLSSLDPSHGECKMQFSTLVVAHGNFTGTSSSSSSGSSGGDIASKWSIQGTIATIFFSTALFWLVF